MFKKTAFSPNRSIALSLVILAVMIALLGASTYLSPALSRQYLLVGLPALAFLASLTGGAVVATAATIVTGAGLYVLQHLPLAPNALHTVDAAIGTILAAVLAYLGIVCRRTKRISQHRHRGKL